MALFYAQEGRGHKTFAMVLERSVLTVVANVLAKEPQNYKSVTNHFCEVAALSIYS